MRVLGVDYGEKRIGLAVCDPTGELAFPVGTVVRKNVRQERKPLIVPSSARSSSHAG